MVNFFALAGRHPGRCVVLAVAGLAGLTALGGFWAAQGQFRGW